MVKGPHRTFHFIAGAEATSENLRGGVVAIGNFDGVHRGHRAVLDAGLEIAARTGAPSLALTFEPHPRTFFHPDEPVFRLTPPALKAERLATLGFDGVVEQRFDAEFAALPAEEFISRVLGGELGAAHVVAGQDFHFGRGRAGTPDLLVSQCGALGIGVTLVEPRSDETGEVISSTRIREALGEGDLALANRLLGYCWTVRGVVIEGKKIGRTLGYPTANLALPAETQLKHGIYAVRVSLPDGKVCDGVASYGRRPTFDNGEALLEAFLFNFSGDLYGREIDISLAAFLREEAKFGNVEALIAQMDVDSREARRILAENPDG